MGWIRHVHPTVWYVFVATGTGPKLYHYEDRAGLLLVSSFAGRPMSIFKGGSTIPVKFKLMDANGNIVQAANLPIWITPQKAGQTSSPIDESVYSDPASNGNYYTLDGNHYFYNWKTKGYASGYYWRIGVTLDDGQSYYVYIGLK